jgi:hypothetical protein
MPVYKVERLYGQELLSSETVEEEDPMKAAERVAGQLVSPRAFEAYWYRVVDEHQAAAHEFSIAAKDGARDFSN